MGSGSSTGFAILTAEIIFCVVTTHKRKSLAGARSKGRFVCRVHRGTGRLADINGRLLRGGNIRGYRRVIIDGKKWMWHVLVAFAATCATGFTPTAEWWGPRTVDHKNGVETDNYERL